MGSSSYLLRSHEQIFPHPTWDFPGLRVGVSSRLLSIKGGIVFINPTYCHLLYDLGSQEFQKHLILENHQLAREQGSLLRGPSGLDLHSGVLRLCWNVKVSGQKSCRRITDAAGLLMVH